MGDNGTLISIVIASLSVLAIILLAKWEQEDDE